MPAKKTTKKATKPKSKSETRRTKILQDAKKETKKSPKAKKAPQREGFTLRSVETGDKVFLVKKGNRHWIMNPQTLAKLGFRLGEERTVSFSKLNKYPEAEPVDLAVALPTPKSPQEATPSTKKQGQESKEPLKPHKVWA